MTITDFSGPLVVFRDGGVLSNSSANQNPDEAPSLFLQATGLLDPRPAYTFYPGAAEGPIGFSSAGVALAAAPALGWLNARFQVADYAPGTASTTSLDASSAITTTSFTLTATSGGNITTGSSCVNPQTGATVTGLWLIDSKPTYVAFGESGALAIWDPAYPAIGRAVSVSNTATSSLATYSFTINGYDAYGNPISQTITGLTTSSTIYTSKTYKWVSSVTASPATSSTVSIGVADIYGFPMYAGAVAYIDLHWDNIPQTGQTNSTFTAGTTLTTAGAGDVRGTVNLTGNTVSDGTIKMQLWQSVNPNNISTVAGLFGVTPA